MNWRGRPLTSHEVIVELIGSTSTSTGLQVHAELDIGLYATGIKISDKQFSLLKKQQIQMHNFHSDWNLWNSLPRLASSARLLRRLTEG